MKILRKAIVFLFLVAVCVVPMAEAADPRPVFLAGSLASKGSGSGEEVAVSCFVKRYELMDLYAETKRILFGISPEYAPDIRGTFSSRIPAELDGSYVRLNIYASHEAPDLGSDPRILSELETLNALGTWEEKVREINHFVSRASYDDTFDPASGVNAPSATALGCLNGTATCLGYANLGAYLYDAVGIENVKVWCSIQGEAAHIFNVVRDDGGTLYAVDSTFSHSGHDSVMLSLEEYR